MSTAFADVIVAFPPPLLFTPAPQMDPQWGLRAACRGIAEGMSLFPHDREPTKDAATRLRPFAARYCRPCGVRVECGAHAQPYGVWGGVLHNRDAVVDLLAPRRGD